jgi:hypothetical protein
MAVKMSDSMAANVYIASFALLAKKGNTREKIQGHPSNRPERFELPTTWFVASDTNDSYQLLTRKKG